MATKTFKIGEYARGGIITVETKGDTVIIIGKDWDHSAGTRKSSDQSNAKEFTRETIQADQDGAERKMLDFLCDLTTSYYADQVMTWIKTKVKVYKSLHW